MIEEKSWPTENFSIIHHAKGNNMASPTQTVVVKGKLNPLITENLLKILRDMIPTSPSKSHTNSLRGMVGSLKVV